MAKNKRGQFTGTNMISTITSKKLQNIADEVSIKVKPIIRDELQKTLISEIYASYTPATDSGRASKETQQTAKRPYEHKYRLESSVYAVINGDVIQAKLKNKQYRDGKTVSEVYDYLKFGTTDTPSNDVYMYGNGKFSRYVAQEPHNFEARTRKRMDLFLDDLLDDLRNNPEKYAPKYADKRRNVW